MARLEAAAWSSTDPELLTLASLRVAEMLGGDPAASAGAVAIDAHKRASLADWDSSPLFSSAERAHLAFTEQFVTSVRHVSDADVDALLEHASPEQVRSFVAALYAVELAQRVDLVARVVLGNGGGDDD
jgi:alkylhydroperoxidase family enzyme